MLATNGIHEIHNGRLSGIIMLKRGFYFSLSAVVAFIMFHPDNVGRVIDQGNWFQRRLLYEFVPWCMWFLMEAGYAFTFAPFVITTGIYVKPMMNNSLVATNMREFWGRWNMLFKDQFQTIVFPLFATRQSSRLRKLVATMAVFIVSGLIHEYFVEIMFHDSKHRFGYNLTFFASHGILTIASEVLIPQNNISPKIKWIVTHLTLSALSWMFVYPYLLGTNFQLPIIEKSVFADALFL